MVVDSAQTPLALALSHGSGLLALAFSSKYHISTSSYEVLMSLKMSNVDTLG